MAAPLLALEDIHAGYGATVILEGINVAIGRGESLSILGRNGVGKTTLLRTIMGHTTIHRGRVTFEQTDMTAHAIHRRARAGLGLVPQEREIFKSLTVTENLAVARQHGRWTAETVFELFPRLRERRKNLGSQLSGGEQQMLAIARALMGNPRVLLMDEPSEGLAPIIVEDLVEVMVRLKLEGEMAILLVEQHTRIALEFSERALVLDRGRIVYDGASQALAQNEDRLNALMGISAQR